MLYTATISISIDATTATMSTEDRSQVHEHEPLSADKDEAEAHAVHMLAKTTHAESSTISSSPPRSRAQMTTPASGRTHSSPAARPRPAYVCLLPPLSDVAAAHVALLRTADDCDRLLSGGDGVDGACCPAEDYQARAGRPGYAPCVTCMKSTTNCLQLQQCTEIQLPKKEFPDGMTYLKPTCADDHQRQHELMMQCGGGMARRGWAVNGCAPSASSTRIGASRAGADGTVTSAKLALRFRLRPWLARLSLGAVRTVSSTFVLQPGCCAYAAGQVRPEE